MYDEDTLAEAEVEATDEMPPLPTVEECQRFMEVINAGRAAIGLPTLAAVNYDECETGHPEYCLSATHLFNAVVDDAGNRVGGAVGTTVVNYLDAATWDALEEALGAERWSAGLLIPEAIRRVTDYFDQCSQGDRDWEALRYQFVEAGLLDA